MKLLLCLSCGDIRAIHRDVWTTCRCGENRGRYEKGANAMLEGPTAMAIGFHNNSFDAALSRARMDRSAKLQRHFGHAFSAFIIPWNAPTLGLHRRCPCGAQAMSIYPKQKPVVCSCQQYALTFDTNSAAAIFARQNSKAIEPRTTRRRSRKSSK